jgi:micrococcal nuclease
MNNIARREQKRTHSKIIPFGFHIAVLVIMSQLTSCIPAVNDVVSPAPSPAIDIEAIYTQAMQTAFASLPTTAPTLTPLPTDTPFVTATQLGTPTLTVLATPTLANINLPSRASCIPDTPPQTGKVVDVVDGDTIKVLLDEDGLTYPLRYIGMDTPENTTQTEYYGGEASAKNSELVYGKNVVLYRDLSEVDRYGRLLRYVYAGDVFVNYELVALGFAEAKRYPPDTACAAYYSQAQQAAVAASLGMWAAAAPQQVIASTPASSVNAGSSTCVCSSNSYNCKDFPNRAAAQACFESCRAAGAGDVHHLDADNNGQACEAMQ